MEEERTSLTSRGYGLVKAAFPEKVIADLRKELTVSPQTVPGFDANVLEFPVFVESPSKVYVPKYFGLQRFGAPDRIKLFPGDPISVPFVGGLRPEQMVPVNSYLEACRDPLKRGGLLMLPCGMGKTVMAIYLACQLGVKTMVIVHKGFLLKQWKERIEQYAPTARVGVLQGKTLDVEGKDIVVAMLQSLSMKEFPEATFRSFGMVIIDEVHHVAAEVFSQALHKVNFQYALGLSASVRKDGLTKVYKWFLGDVICSVKRKEDGVVHVHLIDFWDSSPSYSTEYKVFNGQPNVSRMINSICAFEPRNVKILACMLDAKRTSPERKILVLSDRRAHLERLAEMCRGHPDVFRSVGFYVGGMKEHDLREAESCEVIMGTYSMASEGMDIPALNMVVLASPKTDVMQSIGRILRQKQHERVVDPLVIDIVDKFSLFENQGKRRQEFYRKAKYKVKVFADPKFPHLAFKRFEAEGKGCLFDMGET